MPAQYMAIRDELETEKGMDENEAQAHAAAIYNSTHKDAPVTGKSEPRTAAVHQHLRKHMRRRALLHQMGK